MTKNRVPRGIRNNNPLNIRYVERSHWVGRRTPKKDASFEEFDSRMYGYRAAFILLHKYMVVYKRRTISDIVARWAPVADGNDTWQYITLVSQRSHVKVNEELRFEDWESLTRVVHAMAFVENGVNVPYKEVLEGYKLAAAALHISVNVTEIDDAIRKEVVSCAE